MCCSVSSNYSMTSKNSLWTMNLRNENIVRYKYFYFKTESCDTENVTRYPDQHATSLRHYIHICDPHHITIFVWMYISMLSVKLFRFYTLVCQKEEFQLINSQQNCWVRSNFANVSNLLFLVSMTASDIFTTVLSF